MRIDVPILSHLEGQKCEFFRNAKEKTYIYQRTTTALLTIYDMCKAVDLGMTITDMRVLQKHGGKSGSFVSD